jgi:hypothetical protein
MKSILLCSDVKIINRNRFSLATLTLSQYKMNSVFWVLIQSVGDKNGRCLTKDFEICCLSIEPEEKYKFSTWGVVNANRHLE